MQFLSEKENGEPLTGLDLIFQVMKELLPKVTLVAGFGVQRIQQKDREWSRGSEIAGAVGVDIGRERDRGLLLGHFRERRFLKGKSSQLLRLAVFKDGKILSCQVCDRAGLVGGNYADKNHSRVGANGRDGDLRKGCLSPHERCGKYQREDRQLPQTSLPSTVTCSKELQVYLRPQAYPRQGNLVGPALRSSIPAVLFQFGEERLVERARIAGGDVLTNVIVLAHAGDLRADGRMRQNEAQRHIRQGHSRRQNLFQLVDALESVGQVLGAKISRAPVVFGESSFGSHLAAEAAFIERHAGDYADVEFLANGEQFVLGCLVEDVVDDLYDIDQSGTESFDSVLRLPAVDTQTEVANPAVAL